MGIELIALDLDGTLVDSAPDLCHCLGVALETVGLPAPSEPQTRGWVGGGIELLLRRALVHAAGPPAVGDDGVLPAALAAFSACYERNLYVRSRLYEGVATALGELGARGIPLYCITNKRLEFAEGLLGFFSGKLSPPNTAAKCSRMPACSSSPSANSSRLLVMQ